MAEHVRIRKLGTRSGRPVMLEDDHVVEGDEVTDPICGMPYLVRRTVKEEAEAPDVFNTSTVRVVCRGGEALLLLTDNSRYRVEVIGR